MMVKATVLHSVGPGMLWHYDPKASRLYYAHTFQLAMPDDALPENMAEVLWHLCNIDAEELAGPYAIYAPQVREYRQRLNRSLSMGDVVLLERVDGDDTIPLGSLHAVSLGWEPLEGFPPFSMDGDDGVTSASFVAHQLFKDKIDQEKIR